MVSFKLHFSTWLSSNATDYTSKIGFLLRVSSGSLKYDGMKLAVDVKPSKF